MLLVLKKEVTLHQRKFRRKLRTQLYWLGAAILFILHPPAGAALLRSEILSVVLNLPSGHLAKSK